MKQLDKMTDIPAERDISISHREVVDCTCVVWPTAVRERERESVVEGGGGREQT